MPHGDVLRWEMLQPRFYFDPMRALGVGPEVSWAHFFLALIKRAKGQSKTLNRPNRLYGPPQDEPFRKYVDAKPSQTGPSIAGRAP